MDISVNTKLLLIFTLTFILFTPIGTITHEYGHILVAEFFGYKTTLHYGSMEYNNDQLVEKLVDVITHTETQIESFDEIDNDMEYAFRLGKFERIDLLITIGGVLQTILTATAGLLYLLYYKKRIRKNGLSRLDWLAVFLSLFWLRSVFNLALSITGEIIAPNGTWFGGDELLISKGLNLWAGTIPIILAAIGTILSTYVIFKILPIKIRLTFILSGFVGGIFGFIIWMKMIGPVVLP